jgi:microcystin-dependent protein
MVTKSDLQEMYSRILPYLGGSADAGFTPIGTIIAVFSETAPANYLICDGATYNKADYPELAAHLLALTTHSQYEVSGDSTKFKVPDLRGEFLRGTGSNGHSNQGNGSNVGVHQNATEHVDIIKMSLNDSDKRFQINSSSNIDTSEQANNRDTSKTRASFYQVAATTKTNTSSGISTYTARPTNTSVLFCIATKNIYLNPSLDYSTDEKVVGSWIDGKPIYQITISLAALGSDAASVRQEVPISNIDKVIEWTGACESATVYRPLPYSYPRNVSGNITYLLTTVFLTYEQNKYYINSTSANYDFSNHEGYITLRYTKTTD